MRAFVFPGQGSQFVGMGQELSENFSEARRVFEEVDDALSQKLSKIIFEGLEEQLRLTTNVQPALLAVGMATVRVLEKESGKKLASMASFVAGHSLGEWVSLTAVGAFDLRDAARLLRIRGEAMQKAVPVDQGAMAALIGVSLEEAEESAQFGAQQTGQVCVVANDNAPGQIVISGAKEAVQQAAAQAKEQGKRVVMLPVSAPFHCPLMQPAADVVAGALETVQINTPEIPIISNVSAQAVTDPDVIKKGLVQQIPHCVRWSEGVQYLVDKGVVDIIELGPKKVLSGLNKRINPKIRSFNAQSPAEIDHILQHIN